MKEAENQKKLAVLFPGIGYTCDRSLLYFAGRLAGEAGFEVRRVPYGSFPKGVKGDPVKMRECFRIASEQAEELLEDAGWEAYGEIVFISKSIGTVVSAHYARVHGLRVRSVLFTPLKETFEGTGRMQADGVSRAIAFHGTADPWAETAAIRAGCLETGTELFVTEGANHSLETGDALFDVRNLAGVMERVNAFLRA